MRYGIPYMGSKSRIATWVIENLPAADTFVDLFAGGCAVTHAAMLSGKYKRFIANDISDSVRIFEDAIHGEYDGYSVVPTREEFKAADDPVIKLLYSFGNDMSTYLWGPDIEGVKVAASRMLAAPSMHERRMGYKDFIRQLGAYLDRQYVDLGSADRLQGLERLEALERLQSLKKIEGLQGLTALERMQGDYQAVTIPDGACVYADPPYKRTLHKDAKTYGAFDYQQFESWLAEVDHPVYVSEYDAPAGCVCVAEKETISTKAATGCKRTTEKLFLQERYV